MVEKITGEEAVRLYLLFLRDPGKLRDEQQIKKLQAEVEKAKDPVDELMAIAALERAEAVDGTQFRQDFVQLARPWAEEHQIPASVFQRLGVPDDDLIEAGFDVGRRRTRRAAAAAPRQRAKAVPIDSVKAAMPSSGTFTVRDLEERSGGSPATVRKALTQLLESGAAEDLGKSPDYHGRGRAPTLYRATTAG